MAGAAMVLGLSVLTLGGLTAGHAASPPPAPAPTRSPLPAPVITLGFDDGTDDHLGIARILGRQKLPGVFYVNSGRLGDPKYLSLEQVRQMQRDGHEIGGHTVFHLQLSQQDAAEQKRAVCVDRNQLLAAGIQATDFAYPFSDPGTGTASLARACGYRSARATDGIGCRDCPDAESIRTGDRFRSRALSGFGPDTTAHDLKRAVKRIKGTDGWLQMVFHRICTTSCDSTSVRAGEFAEFIEWLAEQRDAGTVRTATVRQALNSDILPGVAPPRATATTVAFQNNSFEQPGPAAGAPPRCFTYSGLGRPNTATWSRVTDSRRGKVALRAVLTPASGENRLVTTPDLGSCAPPIRAGAHYQVGFWYKATRPIKATTYARRPLGGYRAFGSATVFPASPAWSLASWKIGPAPAGNSTALSLRVSLTAAGVYTFDDFAIATLPERPAYRAKATVRHPPRHAKARPRVRPAAEINPSRAPVAFVPPDLNPQLPKANRQAAGNDLTGPPAWLGYGEIAGAILLAFVAVVILDRRFGHLHRRTRLKVPSERGGGPES
jgi:peptidoglycan/xylan/chitin deacetylase (PgdA/CDA1 family)